MSGEATRRQGKPAEDGSDSPLILPLENGRSRQNAEFELTGAMGKKRLKTPFQQSLIFRDLPLLAMDLLGVKGSPSFFLNFILDHCLPQFLQSHLGPFEITRFDLHFGHCGLYSKSKPLGWLYNFFQSS